MNEPNAELRMLPAVMLAPHPDNPRLLPREDIINRIAAEITDSGFGHEHALLVRPLNGGYQIVSGHHRAEAAKLAGLDDVPCWVRDLTDDEAFMQLVLANTQGELSPLEIGIHALTAVPLSVGGRGKHGGLSKYAERIGWSDDSVRQWRSAAEVLRTVQTPDTCREFTEKTRHLHEISRAPRECWRTLTARLLAADWSVAETAAQVGRVRKFDIPAEHAGWLPLAEVVAEFLRRDRLNPAAVTRLVSAADAVFAFIDEQGTGDDREAFSAWLAEHAGGESWDVKAIGRYHAALIREVAERRAAEAESVADDTPKLPEGVEVIPGDFRDVFGDYGLDGTGETVFPAGTVDAIITDPPYPAEFLGLFGRTPPRTDPDTGASCYSDFENDGLAEIAARILKPGGICAVMVGQSYLPEIIARMGHTLTYHWTLAYLTPGGQAVQQWDRKVNSFSKLILVYVNGEYAGDWFGDVVSSDVNDNDKKHHHWGQSESGMTDWIERLTRPGQLICDPFLGGGTTAVVAHALGRRFVGCDIDEACIEVTTARFAADGEEAA